MMQALRSPTWWVGVAFMGFAVYVIVAASGWSFGGRLFPWVVGSGVLLCGLVHTVLGITRGVKAVIEEEGEPGVPVSPRRRVVVIGWIIALLVALPLLGYQIALPLFIVLFMVSEGEKLWLALLVAAGLWAFVMLVLVELIHISLPVSMLEQAMGW